MVDRNAVSCAEQAAEPIANFESNTWSSQVSPDSFERQAEATSCNGRGAASELELCALTFAEFSESIARLARLSAPLLVQGANGTGKSTVGMMVHGRAYGETPPVVINCAIQQRELADGRWFGDQIQSAQGTSLVLDEVEELPPVAQLQLFGALMKNEQAKPSTVGANRPMRVIATTGSSLLVLVGEHRFREELYYRLSALSLTLPPLRQRPSAVSKYARDILRQIAARRGVAGYQISSEAINKLEAYSWPGNIRELENVCQSAATFCEALQITPQDIQLEADADPGASAPPVSHLAGRTLADIEKQAVIETLIACDGNKALTARTLGISEKSIYNKIRRHNICLKRST